MSRKTNRYFFRRMRMAGRPGIILTGALWLLLAAVFAGTPPISFAEDKPTVWNEQEKPIVAQIRTLRKLPDDVRSTTTKRLALQIRELPTSANKMKLAIGLANLSTEGDLGHDTLQEVTTTLAEALRGQPVVKDPGGAADAYLELASLVRYEHMQTTLDNPQLTAAMSKLEADDQSLQHADFTLTDLSGKLWSMEGLRGKVVLVNFWATWCPPCRKEMPDLDTIYKRLQGQGLVILAISDEEAAKVTPFLKTNGVSYPVLLDPDGKVHKLFHVEGIPKSFVYDRKGLLVAQSIDMRTQKQFLDLLAQAGLR